MCWPLIQWPSRFGRSPRLPSTSVPPGLGWPLGGVAGPVALVLTPTGMKPALAAGSLAPAAAGLLVAALAEVGCAAAAGAAVGLAGAALVGAAGALAGPHAASSAIPAAE